jgi:formylglycine-generating enzyme required for sulfatase activity
MNRIMMMVGTVILTLAFNPDIYAAGAASAGLPNKPVEIALVSVKGGCFQMGDAFGDGVDDERPVHKVCVSDFRMGKYEVTQGQWQQVMGGLPSGNKGCPDCPVENVSWSAAQEFIQRLNKESGSKYRLPTEAEWEYAARSGGKLEKYAGGDTPGTVAWYQGNSSKSSHQVGQKQANGLGLYDMSGNVVEWCGDWYGEDYYAKSPQQDPMGPSAGEARVLRGGDYRSETVALRTTSRRNDVESHAGVEPYGFRLVLPFL